MRKGRREFDEARASAALTRPIGRCPDCGRAAEVQIRRPQAARGLPHGCPARACEAPGCPVVASREEMVQIDAETWYCPRHGLLFATKMLVSLYRVDGEADWTAISEVIGETLPEVIAKLEAVEPTECGRATAPRHRP